MPDPPGLGGIAPGDAGHRAGDGVRSTQGEDSVGVAGADQGAASRLAEQLHERAQAAGQHDPRAESPGEGGLHEDLRQAAVALRNQLLVFD